MKRQQEASTLFFALPEAIEMLCLASPMPSLIATLLRLSKVIRARVWDFLVDPTQGGEAWLLAFCHDLTRRFPTPPQRGGCVPIYPVLRPVFVQTCWWDSVVYRPARLISNAVYDEETSEVFYPLTTRESGGVVGRMVMSGKEALGTVPGWMTSDDYVDVTEILDWYLVARALFERWDKHVLTTQHVHWFDHNVFTEPLLLK